MAAELFQWGRDSANLIAPRSHHSRAVPKRPFTLLIRCREFGLVASDRSGELVALPWWVGFLVLRR
jgi:hypothetical protein